MRNRLFKEIFLIGLVLSVLFFVPLSKPALAQTPNPTETTSQIIRVGGNSNNPPYTFLKDGQPAGFDIDLITAVAREMDFEIEISLTSPEQARQDLLDGKIDMLAGLGASSNRDPLVDFSVPTAYYSYDLYVRTGSTVNTLEDIRGKTIIVLSGSIAQDYLEEQRFTSRLVLVDSAEDALRLLSQNDYAGAILNQIQAEYLIRQMEIPDVQRVGLVLLEQKYAFAVAEGNHELLARLNEGLYILNNSGVIHSIQEEWFGIFQKQASWITLRPYVIGLGAALALLISSLIWSWTLRRRVMASTRDLQQSENQYRLLVENLTEGILVSSGGKFLYANSRAADILGYSVDELVGQPISLPIHPEDLDTVMDRNRRRELGEAVSSDNISRIITRNREVRWISIHALLIEWENAPATLILISDITENKRAEDQIQQQLKHMAALRAVDMAITASMDLPLTLRVLLEQVTAQLKVDAASVLLLEENTQQLAYAAGQGFITNAIRDVQLPLGRGFAGQVALQRKLIRVEDLRNQDLGVFPPRWIDNERFTAYIGVPLITKGMVTGVLEIFQRSPLGSDPVWMNFLESIANQAAIAIDNARLLKNLQTANLDLTLAYDATIEGWAHALELRDGETEGHSHRVAAMTVALASEMGLRGDDLLHIRRGSLLHDIGKMAIPDAILKKQDRLTEKDWEIMRMHPIYSVQMLSPIDFLRPALSIPQAHHEWWDGTGYPRKLKAEEIPLAARIFAVVDVWDALIYSRRYREGWEKEKVIQHIQSLSGKQFDPHVVEKFLTFIQNGGQGYADGEPDTN